MPNGRVGGALSHSPSLHVGNSACYAEPYGRNGNTLRAAVWWPPAGLDTVRAILGSLNSRNRDRGADRGGARCGPETLAAEDDSRVACHAVRGESSALAFRTLDPVGSAAARGV